MILSFMLATAEKALNKFLQLDPEVNSRLAPIVGRVISVQFQQLNYTVYFLIQQNGIRLLSDYSSTPDVALAGAPFDFLRLSKASSSSAALFESDIKVTGDLEVAKQFKKIFAELDIDWEEQLSKVTGDVIAHQIGNFMRSLNQWAKKSANSLQQDITEYVQEEVRWLPLRLETQDFFQQVDKTRDAVERLAVRVQRLKQRMHT